MLAAHPGRLSGGLSNAYRNVQSGRYLASLAQTDRREWQNYGTHNYLQRVYDYLKPVEVVREFRLREGRRASRAEERRGKKEMCTPCVLLEESLGFLLSYATSQVY